jgi:hypothetical protein
MIDWKPYTNDRLISEHSSGFYVIKPIETAEAQPLFCPLCESIMRSEMDEESYKKFTCCDSCAITWAYPNREKWNAGWRPTSEEVVNKYKVSHT